MKRNTIQWTALLLCAGMLLGSCGKQNHSEEMIYVKSSMFYTTVTEMYNDPASYLGKQYHLVGELYVSEDSDTGETIYSVAGTSGSDAIGLELSYDSFEGFSEGDRITVEGKLEQISVMHHGEEIEILILQVSLLEKRE
ncbi:MAG: hypothetical protein IKM30_08365 [Oscillospiraceae bacterium]|nr:hypothetical protein [Oscillospiraceae bacterium]